MELIRCKQRTKAIFPEILHLAIPLNFSHPKPHLNLALPERFDQASPLVVKLHQMRHCARGLQCHWDRRRCREGVIGGVPPALTNVMGGCLGPSYGSDFCLVTPFYWVIWRDL